MNLRLYGLIGGGVVLATLVAAVLWLRGDLAKAQGDKKALAVELQATIEANKSAEATIEGFRNQRVDNDKIAEAVVTKLTANRALFERRTILLKEARNVPQVRDWANTAVPGSVREALSAVEVREQPR